MSVRKAEPMRRLNTKIEFKYSSLVKNGRVGKRKINIFGYYGWIDMDVHVNVLI